MIVFLVEIYFLEYYLLADLKNLLNLVLIKWRDDKNHCANLVNDLLSLSSY